MNFKNEILSVMETYLGRVAWLSPEDLVLSVNGQTGAVSLLPDVQVAYQTIASAATTNIGALTSQNVNISGTATITAFDTVAAGITRKCVATGAFTLTHNATSLICPSAANIVCAAGDTFEAISLGSGNWKIFDFQRANGTALVRSAAGQVVRTVTGAVSTGTTIIPDDDTIPQNTEGDEYMSLAITPANASSTLQIDVVIFLSEAASANHNLTAALFKDSTADALACAAEKTATDSLVCLTLKHFIAAGSTSTTTFKIRAGTDTAATTTFNGVAGARLFGGVLASSITISEILP